MSSFSVVLATLSLILGLLPAIQAQTQPDDIQVEVTLSRDSIGLDEYALLEVLVSGAARDLPPPNLPTLPMFEVYSQGQSSNLSIINGQVEASVMYRYMIMPQKAGTYPIENISVVYQNRRYRANAVTLTVLNQGAAASDELEQKAQDTKGNTKDYFLEAAVDNKTPYVNEQVTLTLKFFIAVRYYGSPELAEPSTTGFWTEVLGNKAPYQQRLNDRTYRVIERKYALFPTQTGVLTIGRAIITATVASQNRRRDPFDVFGLGSGEEIKVNTQPITIRVKPLPDAGRPSDFTGTIGRFTIAARPSRNEVEVNQPVSVEIKLQGTGNVKSVAEPVIPELADFRVYKASSNESVSKYNDQIGGVKTFEEVFIPKRPGKLEIPSLSLSFFDPEQGTYRTVRTQPIRLTVTKPEGYVADDNNLPYAGPDQTISADARDIRYIKTVLGETRERNELVIISPLYLAVNALPVLLLAGSVLMRVRREKLAGNEGLVRARGASKQARKRLAKARALLSRSDRAAFWVECSEVVTAFVADKLNISPHGLTSESLSTLLAERGADQQTIADTVGFLSKCDFARYAPGASGATDMQAALQTAEDLMVRMEGVRF